MNSLIESTVIQSTQPACLITSPANHTAPGHVSLRPIPAHFWVTWYLQRLPTILCGRNGAKIIIIHNKSIKLTFLTEIFFIALRLWIFLLIHAIKIRPLSCNSWASVSTDYSASAGSWLLYYKEVLQNKVLIILNIHKTFITRLKYHHIHLLLHI